MNTILVLARNTISEALRRKILNAVLMVSIAIMCLFFAFQQLQPRSEFTLIKSLGLGMISLAGVLISVILSINLIPTEIERRTIYTILSKPVRRHEFLLGKYLGALGTVFINIFLMSLVFIAVVAVKQVLDKQPVDAYLLFKGVLMTYMQLLLLCSVAIFFSVFVTPLVNFFLTLSTFIVGNLSTFTEDLGKTSQLPVSKWFFMGVHYIVPNFANFQYTNPLIRPDIPVKSETLFLTQNVIYALVYSAVLLILAILIFDRREV